MRQQVVLGIGSGRCGTLSLAQLLDAQPIAEVTHERRPLLPWSCGDRETLVSERIATFRRNSADIVGDIASFYLPYVEEFIRQEPSIRVVVLQRDCEEVVKSFSDWSDHAHAVRADHWSEHPAPGLHHDPVWSTIFPKYPTTSRDEGIRRYWHEYYERVAELLRAYPENIRHFDMNTALNTAEGQTQLLTFVGIPVDRQVLNVD